MSTLTHVHANHTRSLRGGEVLNAVLIHASGPIFYAHNIFKLYYLVDRVIDWVVTLQGRGLLHGIPRS
jgi:hypothetical protein